MTMTMKILPCAILALAALAAPASAAVPHELTFTARLVDDGTPFEGAIDLSFDLYAAPSGGTSIWTESASTTASLGLVAVRLGTTTPLDTAVIDGGDLYLQVTVDSTVLSPRLAIGSVPYAVRAAYADECGAVPAGSVMFFDLDACPAGWSPLDAARGRAIVGTPAGGAVGGTVGAPLGDVENRAHGHTVDPASTATAASGAHDHTVNPAQVTSSAVNLAHTHDVDPALFTATGGVHNHAWAIWTQSSLMWNTWNSDGTTGQLLVDYTNGLGGTGTGSYPLETDQGATDTFYTADSTPHSHDIDVPPTTSGGTSTSMNHGHLVDVATTTSSTAATHTHAVDVASTASSTATTGEVMPYLQLLACRRD